MPAINPRNVKTAKPAPRSSGEGKARQRAKDLGLNPNTGEFQAYVQQNKMPRPRTPSASKIRVSSGAKTKEADVMWTWNNSDQEMQQVPNTNMQVIKARGDDEHSTDDYATWGHDRLRAETTRRKLCWTKADYTEKQMIDALLNDDACIGRRSSSAPSA